MGGEGGGCCEKVCMNIPVDYSDRVALDAFGTIVLSFGG